MTPLPGKLDSQQTKSVYPLISQWQHAHKVHCIVLSVLLFSVIIVPQKSHRGAQSDMYPIGLHMSIKVFRFKSWIATCVLDWNIKVPLTLSDCGNILHAYLAQRPPPVISDTLAWSVGTTSQAASCTTSCHSKCAPIANLGLYYIPVECRLWLMDAVCTPSHTHASHTSGVCLCSRGSVKFKCLTGILHRFLTFGPKIPLFAVILLRSKKTNTLTQKGKKRKLPDPTFSCPNLVREKVTFDWCPVLIYP